MKAVTGVRLVDEVIDYIAALVRGTRENLRSRVRRVAARRGHARGRGAVARGDRRTRLRHSRRRQGARGALLRHRVILSPAAEINGRKVEEIVTAIIKAIEAPR